MAKPKSSFNEAFRAVKGEQANTHPNKIKTKPKRGLLYRYKFHGDSLNEAQKTYNKAVDRAWRRIKYMKKKYNVEAELPELPPTTYSDEVEKATKRLENIRTDVYANPTKRRERIDLFIQDFIDDISNYIDYVDTSSIYQSVWNLNAERARRWRDRAIMAIRLEVQSQGEEAFYNNINRMDKVTKLKDLVQRIYSLPSDDKVESASTGLFNDFLFVLRGSGMDVVEMASFNQGEDDELMYDGYSNQLDIESWQLAAQNMMLEREE